MKNGLKDIEDHRMTSQRSPTSEMCVVGEFELVVDEVRLMS